MPKPYNLRVYSSVLEPGGAKFQMDLTRFNTGWRHSTRIQGGYWQGSFRLSGQSEQQLLNWFWTWLGYDVKEISGGVVTWQGMIYEMDLTVNGVRRRRSLDLMANAVATTYTKSEYSGDNMIGNNSFEDAGGGGVDVFAGWTEATGTGGGVAQTNVVAEVYDGTYAVRLTGDDDGLSAVNTYVRQNIEVTPGNKYKLTYWTRGDGSHQGRIGINDPNIGGAAGWVVPVGPTGVPGTTYLQRAVQFVGPSEGEVQVFCIAPNVLNGLAYFDKLELYEYLPGVYNTGWKDNEGGVYPQNTYGRKEQIIHLDEYEYDTSLAYRDTYWKQRAWPWARPVSAVPPGAATLDVSVAGYVFTANWLYVLMGDGQAHDLDHWIRAMAGTEYGLAWLHGGNVTGGGDCQFLKAGTIRPNDYLSAPDGPLQVTETTGLEERPWDRMMELAELGDAAGNPWRVYVGNWRLLHYEPISVTPRYYIRNDGIFDTAGGAKPSNAWQMQPGVFRDMTYRSGYNEPGSFLDNNQDIFVEEVEMADGWSRPALKTALLDESELLRAQMEMEMLAGEGPPPAEWPPRRLG